MPNQITRDDQFLIFAAVAILAYLIILDIGAFWGGCHNPPSQTETKHYADYDDCAVNGIRLVVSDIAVVIHQRRDDLTAISTAFIAIFTIVLAFVTGRQARLTRIVADAGRQAADAAKASADALPTLERAHVFAGVKGSGVGADSDGNPVVIFSVSAINYGRTPGVVNDIGFDIVPFVEDPTDISNAIEEYRNKRFVNWLLSPQGAQEQLLAVCVVPKPLREKTLFYGIITYDDIFGGNHWCGFAYRVEPDGSFYPIRGMGAYTQRD